jgi:6-phosphogluconolactonase
MRPIATASVFFLISACGGGSGSSPEPSADEDASGGSGGGRGGAAGSRGGSGGNAGGSGGSGADDGGRTGGAGGTAGIGGPPPDGGGEVSREAGADADSPDASSDGPQSGDDAAAAKTYYVYVGGASEITTLTLDIGSGALSRKGMMGAGSAPGYLAWDAEKKYLYAAQGSPGRVIAYAINRMTGALTRINDASTAGMGLMSGVTHLSVHPSGKWVLTAHFASGHVAVLPVREDGGVGTPVFIHRPADQAHQIISDAAAQYVFVPCRDGNVVAQYRIDVGTGRLMPNNPASVRAAPGAGPRHMDFHPSGKYAYVINEKNGTMTSYKYDAETGRLSDPATSRTTPAGFSETAAAHVVVHPSGAFVYGSNRRHQSIVIFSVDEATGRLKLVGHEMGGGLIDTPRDFTVDPTGRYLLVANQGRHTVLVFRIDQATGRLTRIGSPVSVARGPAFVGVLPLP